MAKSVTKAVKAGTGLVKTGNTFSVSYGITSITAAVGNDSRLSDSRAPSGSAGGALDGTYPNPGLAATVAGAGLTETSNVLAVGAGTGISVAADSVALAPIPSCRITKSTQNITSNSFTDLDFDAFTYDNALDSTMRDLTNNRVYARRTGLYIVTLGGVFATDATGGRYAAIIKDGTALARGSFANMGGIYGGYTTVTTINYAVSGSYFSAQAYQASGSTLAFTGAYLEIVWVGSQA